MATTISALSLMEIADGESEPMRQSRFVRAAAENNVAMMRTLLFPHARREGESESGMKTRVLIQAEEHPDLGPVDVNGFDTYGYTALVSAVSAGMMGAIDFLLTSGADINLRDSHGFAPIHEACYNERMEAMHYMMQPQWNMDIRLKTFDGDTPLDIVVQLQYAEMINLFSRPYFCDKRGYLYKGDEPAGALDQEGNAIDPDAEEEAPY
jgi:ankyrin repeat protein